MTAPFAGFSAHGASDFPTRNDAGDGNLRLYGMDKKTQERNDLLFPTVKDAVTYAIASYQLSSPDEKKEIQSEVKSLLVKAVRNDGHMMKILDDAGITFHGQTFTWQHIGIGAAVICAIIIVIMIMAKSS